MHMRVVETGAGKMVAACDRELIGQVLRSGKIVLDLKKHAVFYKEREGTVEELKEELKGAASANLVGKKSVGCAIACGLAGEESILFIGKVPHLQIYRI